MESIQLGLGKENETDVGIQVLFTLIVVGLGDHEHFPPRNNWKWFGRIHYLDAGLADWHFNVTKADKGSPNSVLHFRLRARRTQH